MDRKNLFISTVAKDAVACAKENGLGLEIAEFCTACNMDTGFNKYDAKVRHALAVTDRAVFHAPFNELYPSAIDPKAVELAHSRFKQATALSQSYGIRRIVVHSGYVPSLYAREWFLDRSVIFWKRFLRDLPHDITIYCENVMETEPTLLCELVQSVNDVRFMLCLDVGHVCYQAGAYDIDEWLRVCAPYIGHFHIHNNYNDMDSHNAINDGKIDMARFLTLAKEQCPDASYTIESRSAQTSVAWLIENAFLTQNRR